MHLYRDSVKTQFGTVVVATDDAALCALDFADYEARMLRLLRGRFGDVRFTKKRNPLGVCDAIRAYAAGQLGALDSIRVDTGGTPFQRKVWNRLRKVPAGRTASYGDIARAVGAPKAFRAVGTTNGRNPVVLVVPCHRIIAGDGGLGGYGGGLERKRMLLEHEGVAARSMRG